VRANRSNKTSQSVSGVGWSSSLKGKNTMFDSQKIAVFLPANTTVLIATIVVRGSAIVGPVGSNEANLVTVYYEGNLLGYANVKTYADRAKVAAGRLAARYPTIARSVVSPSALRQVGWFDPENGITLLDDTEAQEALVSWLGVEVIEEKELQFSHR
jgi:hypothetical protein